MDAERKREVLWVLCIFAALAAGFMAIIGLDLWVPVQNFVRLEIVWLLSAIFITSFIIIAVLLHHHKVAKGKKKSVIHEFREMSPLQKTALVTFIISLSLIVVAIFLTRIRGIKLTPFEREEELFIAIVSIVAYIYMIIQTIKKEG